MASKTAPSTRADTGVLGYLNNKLLSGVKIGVKINIGFGILVALTLAVIGVSYLSSTRVTADINRTAELRTPTALTAARAQTNLLRMLAEVRGYLALGDQQYRHGYDEAKQAFERDLIDLENRMHPGIMAYDSHMLELKRSFARWVQLPEKLFDLHDDQLEREPALRLLLKDANPRIAQILVAVKGMLVAQKRRQPSIKNMDLLSEIADFQASFFAMVAGLRGYVTTGRGSFKFEYNSNLAINDAAVRHLRDSEALLTRSQQSALKKLLIAREAFLPLPEQMFAAVEGEHAREDLYLFRTQAIPPAENMLTRLREVTLGEQGLLEEELNEATSQLGTVQNQIFLAAVAALVLGIGLAYLLQRNIVGPIRRLTGVAERIGAGDLQARAVAESTDEIGTLAVTFNEMADQLRQTLDDLEERRNELQIAAGTLRRQNEYLGALHGTTLGLISRLDLNELLETLVTRAAQLVDAPYGYLYLVMPDAEDIELKVAVGLSAQQFGEREQRGSGLAGQVWQTGEPLVINDYEAWSCRSPNIAPGLIGALVGMPLLHQVGVNDGGSQVVGVIGLGYDIDSGRVFGDDEIELISRFAQLATVVLDNARLFEQAQQANQELSQALANLQTTQKQLVDSEKMAALGGLVAGVAHEINTPVSIGVTAASLLERQTGALLSSYQNGTMKRSALLEYLETATESSRMILTNLNRAAELIQSFKQVAVDQSSEERREFAVKPYLEEILLSLRPRLRRTRLEVIIKGSDDLVLNSYPGDFSQIVTNLVMNSLLHAYEPEQSGRLIFELGLADRYFVMEYADDGCGIATEHLSKIFDPFFTTRRGHGGSGLGLYIIYNLITQKLNGTIRCVSQTGDGARFIVKLPLDSSLAHPEIVG